jgi:hypothetical protein
MTTAGVASSAAIPAADGVALLGMPGTGKSTFLAALYHLFTEDMPNMPATLLRQPDQRAYLQSLRAAWLAGEEIGRTSKDDGELIELDLLVGERHLTFSIPDIAGECFRDVVVNRQADALIAQIVRDASGLLLFTHPDHLRPRVLISEARELTELVGEEYSPPEAKEFDPLTVPGEVHDVDLLQWIADTRGEATPTRLAVVVSAWDRCDGLTPEQWLAARMPMLRHYLDGHPERYTSAVYGVSAQGGAYGSAVDLASLRGYERAYVVDGAGTRSGDLTAPLRWAALQ